MSQSVITNTVIATSGRSFNIALGVFALALVSRFLGVAQFGIYATILAAGAIIQIMADAGLYLMLTRALGEQPTRPGHLLGQVLALRILLLLSFFSLGALLIILQSALRPYFSAYLLISLGLCAQSLSQLFMGVYQKYGVIWRATVGDIIGRLTQLAGLIIFGATRISLELAAGIFSLGAAAAFIIHRFLLPVPAKPILNFSWGKARPTLIASAPLAALLVLNVIHFRIDLVLLSLLRTAAEAGLYGIAYRLIESLLFLPAMFSGLLLPRLTAAYRQHQTAKLHQYLNQGLLFLVWLAAFITLSFLYLAPDIINLVSGVNYAAAALPLRLLSLSLIPLFIGNICGFALVAARQQKTLLLIALLTTALNLTLNLLLIPAFGLLAAALTTLLTETAAAAAVFAAVRRAVSLPFPEGSYAIRLALILSVTSFVYSLTASWPLFGALALGTAVYLASSWLLRLISPGSLSSLLTSVP